MKLPVFLFSLVFMAGTALSAPSPFKSTPETAIAHPGIPKYNNDFQHFDYANPSAPKGGELSFLVQGSYDSFNPYIPHGRAAADTELLYDSLMEFSADEPYSAYGLVAESVERAPDLSWVIFNLRPEARFHDDHPITADDVVFSYNRLITEGDPVYKMNFSQVKSAKALSDHRVLFEFKEPSQRKLPFLLAAMPVLPEHFWKSDKRDFGKSGLTVPLGSGPYKVLRHDNDQVIYERVRNYWAKDLPINKGRHNFDTIRAEYIRNNASLLEAFKSGLVNFHYEPVSKHWYTSYDFPAIQKGDVIKERFKVISFIGMNGFMMNTRRPPLDNWLVREALILLFDFEWTNQHLMFNEYKRVNSYFVNTDLAASGLPSPEELKLLKPFQNQLPNEVFTQVYKPPVTDGSGNIRQHKLKALKLLHKAGWELVDGKLLHKESKKPLTITMINSFPQMETTILPYKKNLNAMGIEMVLHTLDSGQFVRRMKSFDYDLINWAYGHHPVPGLELINQFGSHSKDEEGSKNLSGIQNPAVDHLIRKLDSATSRAELTTYTRALDRALLWGHYAIPKWYMESARSAHDKRLKHPDNIQNLYRLENSVWWFEPSQRTDKVASNRS